MCPFDCQGGECVGECQPGAEKCEGTDVLLCNNNYTWKLDKTCEEEGLVCVALSPEDRDCGQCSPGGAMATEASCHFTQIVSCDESGFWDPAGDCQDVIGNGVCVGKGNCRSLDDLCSLGSTAAGCLDENKGWWCNPDDGRYITGNCDCSDGIACK
jgi:hypothetical protein